MKEKIVVITAGGHIAPFHAGMKGMYNKLNEKAQNKFELVGAKGGLTGLINSDFIPIKYEHLDENKSGSMIGADRKIANTDKIINSISQNNIYAIIMMGGDNHLGEASKCYDKNVNIVGYPKTMDGDLSSHITLGWDTAVTIGSMQSRWHHSNAITYERIFYVGLFGRDTDWNLAAVTAYGGGDFGIPCEKETNITDIIEFAHNAYSNNKKKYGFGFAVIPFSEGANIKGVNPPPKDHISYDAHNLPKLQPEWLGLELVRLTKAGGLNSAFQAHTYDMRDSPPTETDKKLSEMAGEECINMILEGDFGKSAIFEPDANFYKISRSPLIIVSKQRRLKDTDFFNYDILKTNQSFLDTYQNLFNDSLGKVSINENFKDNLVYKNML